MSTDKELMAPRQAVFLLTSGGVTTDAMRERLLGLSKLSREKARLRVVRIADGWQSFSRKDEVTFNERIEQHIVNEAARLWSSRYLRWVIGRRATIHTVTLGDKTPTEANKILKHADLYVVPGGNTYQVFRGLNKHKDMLSRALTHGAPYLGDSAGSIVAGHSLRPAALEPADPCPNDELIKSSGLGLINADIVVHARQPGEVNFDIKGPLASLTRFVLDSYASDSVHYEASQVVPTYYLTENRALLVETGQATLI